MLWPGSAHCLNMIAFSNAIPFVIAHFRPPTVRANGWTTANDANKMLITVIIVTLSNRTRQTNKIRENTHTHRHTHMPARNETHTRYLHNNKMGSNRFYHFSFRIRIRKFCFDSRFGAEVQLDRIHLVHSIPRSLPSFLSFFLSFSISFVLHRYTMHLLWFENLIPWKAVNAHVVGVSILPRLMAHGMREHFAFCCCYYHCHWWCLLLQQVCTCVYVCVCVRDERVLEEMEFFDICFWSERAINALDFRCHRRRSWCRRATEESFSWRDGMQHTKHTHAQYVVLFIQIVIISISLLFCATICRWWILCDNSDDGE